MGRKIAIIIFSVMGFVWCFLTSFTLPHALRLPEMAAGLLISVALMVWTIRQSVRAPGKFDRKIYWLSVGFEVVAIIAASYFITGAHASSYFLAAITIIVGLHFFGMWLATDRKLYLVVMAAQCVCGLAALALTVPFRMWVPGLGSAAILWFAAVWMLRQPAVAMRMRS